MARSTLSVAAFALGAAGAPASSLRGSSQPAEEIASAGYNGSTHASKLLESAAPSCGFRDGFDIKDKVCPQQWQGQYAGTASCKSCWEGEDCGWTCDLTDGTKAGVDLQCYVEAAFGEGHCARNPSNDPCLGWQVFGDGCSDCDACRMTTTTTTTPAPGAPCSPEDSFCPVARCSPAPPGCWYKEPGDLVFSFGQCCPTPCQLACSPQAPTPTPADGTPCSSQDSLCPVAGCSPAPSGCWYKEPGDLVFTSGQCCPTPCQQVCFWDP